MRNRRTFLLVLGLQALLLVPLLAGTLWAHDCSSPGDCEQTAGYNALLAIIGGIMGMLASLLGPLLSGMAGKTEAEAYREQWEEAKKGLDPNSPEYQKLKEQYDNYIKYNEDMAAEAEARIREIQAAAAQQQAEEAAAQQQEEEAAAQLQEWIRNRQDDLKAALEERALLQAVAQGASGAGFDTTAHQDRLKQLNERINELHGQLAKVDGDIAYVPSDRGVIAPGQEFVQIRDDAEAKEQQRALEEARRIEREQLKAQQEELETAMKDAASWRAAMGEMLTTGLGGTAERLGNVVTVGVYDAVKDNWGKGAGAVAGAVATALGDAVTLGFVSGYQQGGVLEGVSNMVHTVLPIAEIGAVTVDWNRTTWDQKLGAVGSGILKTLTLGKIGGKLISTQSLTTAEIQSIKYGYHTTTESNKLSIMRTGLETRSAKGIISTIASNVKQMFKTGEPRKAAYLFGSTEPGWGALGSIDTSVAPLTIDLTKLDPSKLIKRPLDGAIIFTGDKIPSTAIQNTSWGSLPKSPTPYKGDWSTLKAAGKELPAGIVKNGVIGVAKKEILK